MFTPTVYQNRSAVSEPHAQAAVRYFERRQATARWLQIVAVSTGAGAGQEQELLRWVLKEDLAPGSAATFSHDFAGSPVTVSGGLRLQFVIATATDGSRPAVTDLRRVIGARAEVRSVTIESAVVRVADLDLGGEPREFDLGDQDDVDSIAWCGYDW